MTLKKSSDKTNYGVRNGDNLTYELDYQIEKGFAHRYSRIGNRYYKYDEAGNIIVKQEGEIKENDDEEFYKIDTYEDDVYGVNEAWGDEYQRIEYTPYGETWIERTDNKGLEYLPYEFTAKELDEETGLYYFGARYLDSKYSTWISTDPALGEYIPQAPVSDEARKHNQNLPGMGGIFNHINGNLYHYAGNNPVRYIDPNGMFIKDKATEILLQKIFENTKKIEYNQKTREEFEKNLVQARGGKTKIADLIYIGNDDTKQSIALNLLQESVDSDVEFIESSLYRDSAVRKDVAEYWIVTYDPDTEKSGFVYNVLVDIGNDGHIDYIEWIPKELEEEMTK